jgi:hypothetical protein
MAPSGSFLVDRCIIRDHEGYDTVPKFAAWLREYGPGTPAPSDGVYEQRNVFGSTTGTRIIVTSGQTLPAAPRGFTWRMFEPPREIGAGHG